MRITSPLKNYTQHKLKLRNGVSLVELVMVLAISSFMIAIVINGINNGGRASFDNGMRTILNNLREVQNQAASGQAKDSVKTSGVLNNQELFGKGIRFTLTSKDTYKEYYVRRPDDSAPNQGARNYVGSLETGFLNQQADELKKWPAGIELSAINSTVDPSPVTKGMLVFARRTTSGDQVGSKAAPYFFALSAFGDGASANPGRFTEANSAATYGALQTKRVSLVFKSPNGRYSSTIEINTSTGTVELKQ